MNRVKAVGVWFIAQDTKRYLYLMRNDPKHPNAWGLPGGKVEEGETLLGGMERECTEELGVFPNYQQMMPLETFTSADGMFSYHTWVCVIESEFVPELNHEHFGYAWIDCGHWPKPMHPGLWNTVELESVKRKLLQIESKIISS
jgi:8-oxo-dGTP pyrophosphatase MutT (NUDIX family)